MLRILRFGAFVVFLLILVSGCGGTTEPVNEGKDRPISLKKAQAQDKDK